MGETTDVPSLSAELLERGVEPEDWRFCWHRLVEVSRTFSMPIRMLPEELRAATTCGYLLCRIADTIEDHAGLSFERKRDLFGQFLDAVERDGSAERFVRNFAEVPGSGPYHDLARGTDRLLAVYRKLPDAVVRATGRRVGEMSRGMLTFERRRDWNDGVARIETVADLERYCYYVAGTVGHLLTDLFVREFEPVDGGRRRRLRRNAEPFGLGLQMVNILKDQTDDLAEGWCYIPRLELSRYDLDVETLFDERRRADAHRAVAPVIDRAAEHLDAALEYVLAIPAEHHAVRVACLVPLWLAVRTLVHAKGNDAMFEADVPVKITREEVAELAADCRSHAADDDYLRRRYRELWGERGVRSGE